MPRTETDEAMELEIHLQEKNYELQDVIGDMTSCHVSEAVVTAVDPEETPGTVDNILHESPSWVEEQKGNYAYSENGSHHETSSSELNEYDEIIRGTHIPESDASTLSLPWRERKNLKIRYTRQYLLDRRADPLSMAFPGALVKFAHSGEVPLRDPENFYDNRSMDHILFYTSLPYSRVRSSINTYSKRKSVDLCL